MIFEKASEAAEFLKARYPHPIDVAIVLGSGLGVFAEKVTNAVAIPYAEIPHFSKSTVEGHRGRLVLGEIEGKHVAVQQGRFHFYEGYEMDQVTMPVRTFGRLGIKTLLLTNYRLSLFSLLSLNFSLICLFSRKKRIEQKKEKSQLINCCEVLVK